MRHLNVIFKNLWLVIFVFSFFVFKTIIAQGAVSNVQFISFIEGNPGVPGDGISVGSDTIFTLATPFSLAGVSDGITITAFPSISGDLILDLGIGKNAGCIVGLGTDLPRMETVFNGVTGVVFNYSQSRLEDAVDFINLFNPSCNVLSPNELLIIWLDFDQLSPPTVDPDLDAVAIGLGQNNVPKPTTERTVVIERRTDPRGSILLTYQVVGRSMNHIALDLTLQNVARTWFIVRREGNHSAGDQEIPFVFLLGPDGVRRFSNIRFMRGEILRLVADKPGSVGDAENLALGALSIDMFGRGLFGVTLSPNIFDEGLLQLLEEYVFLYKETILTKILLELEIKTLPKIFKEIFILVLELDLSDPATRDLIDELYEALGGATKWAARIVEGALQFLNLPGHAVLVHDLLRSTLNAPDSGFAKIEAR